MASAVQSLRQARASALLALADVCLACGCENCLAVVDAIAACRSRR